MAFDLDSYFSIFRISAIFQKLLIRFWSNRTC